MIPVSLIAHNGTNSPDNTSTFPTTADINDSQTQYNNGDNNVSTMEKHHTTHNTKKTGKPNDYQNTDRPTTDNSMIGNDTKPKTEHNTMLHLPPIIQNITRYK